MRLLFCLCLAAFVVVSCAPMQEPISGTATVSPDTAVTNPPQDEPSGEPVINPFAPQPGDDSLTRGNVFIQKMDVLLLESFPPQIALALSGELPTPCHQLRVQIGEPDAENKIEVEVYSVVDPDLACIQVLEPFEANINMGSFPSGHYSVWVNEELAGEFDW